MRVRESCTSIRCWDRQAKRYGIESIEHKSYPFFEVAQALERLIDLMITWFLKAALQDVNCCEGYVAGAKERQPLNFAASGNLLGTDYRVVVMQHEAKQRQCREHSLK